jgi:pimeloyl-ACP methyl ester carboxylesterase
MGSGKSDTPADHDYLAVEHVDNLEKLLVDELDLREITLVLHDWGGPIGAGFALRHPDRVARMFTRSTGLPLGPRCPGGRHAGGTARQRRHRYHAPHAGVADHHQAADRHADLGPPVPCTSPTGRGVAAWSVSRSSW